MWEVRYIPQAEEELRALPVSERVAIAHGVEKLEHLGGRLSYPHTSNVQGAVNLRELRPRGGRSPWRAFYRRIGDVYVVAAIGPEAQKDRRRFDRAVAAAVERLDDLEED